MSGQRPACLVIGSRGSDLALWQARHVQGLLSRQHPSIEFPIEIVQTEGDRDLSRPLASIPDLRGFFAKEIEEALLAGRIDIAVHSLKDVPTVSPDGLALGAVPAREDPADVWVARDGKPAAETRIGARVGTSSLRRQAQVRAMRADLVPVDLRGNVPTRLARLRDGEYDAIILAKAGLSRLGLLDETMTTLAHATMLPAPAQGALGVQVRADDDATLALVASLDDPESRLAVTAERALLHHLHGGCSAPVAALAQFRTNARGEVSLALRGLVASLDGHIQLRREDAVRVDGSAAPEERLDLARGLGLKVADGLMNLGAEAVLRASREAR